MSNKVAQVINARILEQLQQGEIPWKKSWQQLRIDRLPQNYISGRNYRGINVFNLAMFGTSATGEYLTYNQAQTIGSQVKKGSKGLPVLFFNPPTFDSAQKMVKPPIMRYSTVFAIQDCEGLQSKRVIPAIVKNDDLTRDDFADMIINANPHKLESGDPAYSPMTDSIYMPDLSLFESSEEYYCAYFHELGHWTKKQGRAERPEKLSYAREELVAELNAAYCCGFVGFESVTVKNSAAYIQHWIKQCEDDEMLFIKAGAMASKAFEYLARDFLEIKTDDDQLISEVA